MPLYGYDLDRAAASEAAQQRLQATPLALYGQGGGLLGSSLMRRQDALGDFQEAILLAQRRRALAEMQRLTQEADIEEARRLQAIQLIGGGLSRLGGSYAGLLGLGASPLSRQPAVRHEGLGDPATMRAEERYFGRAG